MAYADKNDPRIKVSKRKHYLKNIGAYIERSKQSKKAMRKYIQLLKSKPCTDCHRLYPYYVMQFDHLHSKEMSIATLVNYNNRAKINAELAKCELVCANCHAERTHRRGIV